MSTLKRDDGGQGAESDNNVVAFLPAARLFTDPTELPFTGAERAKLRQIIERQERIILALSQFEKIRVYCPMAEKLSRSV